MKLTSTIFLVISSIICCNSTAMNDVFIEPPLPIKEVLVNSFPKKNQLYPRNAENKALVNISGTVSNTIDSLILKVHRANGIITRTSIASENNFSFTIEIDAVLHNYTIELLYKSIGKETLVKTATNVTAGDVYVLHGQSNAWAIDYDNNYGNINFSPNTKWVRTIGAMHVYNKPAISPEAENTDWYLARGTAPDIRGDSQFVGNGMVGVLGINIGVNLVASEGVPIAIINGAGGGGAISYYQKTKDNDLNSPYGRLQHRLEASGAKNNIKAFIWNQGENNAGDPVLVYKSALNQLYSAFKKDYSFEKFYVIQTPPGCNAAAGHQTVREAQRQFVEENKNTRILTRHGFSANTKKSDGNYFLSDGCHYHAHGYEILADWISNLAKLDFYNGNQDFQAPKLIIVKLESPTTLIIEFDKTVSIQPDLLVDGVLYSAKDYLFAINNATKTSFSKLETINENQKKVRLTFSNLTIAKGDKLTYILNDNYPSTSTTYRGPWIIDSITGVGAVGFSKIVD